MSQGQVDNEQVIDELTAGLAECMESRLPKNPTGGDSRASDPTTIKPDTTGNAEENGIKIDTVPDPTDQSAFGDSKYFSAARKRFEANRSEDPKDSPDDFYDDPEAKVDRDDDYIDEEALKEENSALTEDQREERRIIADGLKKNGNDAYKNGDYELSIEKYTEGLRQCPLIYTKERAILYCNRSAAKMKLEHFKKAIEDCTKSLQLDDKYLKAYIRRAQSYESSEKLDEALADFTKVLELDPQQQEARRASARLPPLIAERNEKLKTEMLGKLKELGNMVLKPFGLSTENFQVQQDPNSKGYSINFKQ